MYGKQPQRAMLDSFVFSRKIKSANQKFTGAEPITTNMKFSALVQSKLLEKLVSVSRVDAGRSDTAQDSATIVDSRMSENL